MSESTNWREPMALLRWGLLSIEDEGAKAEARRLWREAVTRMKAAERKPRTKTIIEQSIAPDISVSIHPPGFPPDLGPSAIAIALHAEGSGGDDVVAPWSIHPARSPRR